MSIVFSTKPSSLAIAVSKDRGSVAGNLGAQIDPKDIDYIEVQRGSYTSDVGDRTYGVFNVVPRTGFERDREAEVVLSAGSFLQTNDQINVGDHTEKFAYYASLSGNRSDYGLSPPLGQVLHDATNGYGAFASLIYNRTPKDQFRVVRRPASDLWRNSILLPLLIFDPIFTLGAVFLLLRSLLRHAIDRWLPQAMSP